MSVGIVIISIVIAALISGLIIWIVGKLHLGLEVSGFRAAFFAAIVIAVISGLLEWLLTTLGLNIGGGLLGALTHLVVAALVLILSTAFVPGLKVKGVLGALIAVIAIGAMSFVVRLLLSAIPGA
jgi:putative membrane protein